MEDSKKSEYKLIDDLVSQAKRYNNEAFKQLLDRFRPLIVSIRNKHYDGRWDKKTLDHLVVYYFWQGIVDWDAEMDGPFNGFIKVFLMWKLYNQYKHLKAKEWRDYFNEDKLKFIDEEEYRDVFNIDEVSFDFDRCKQIKKMLDATKEYLTPIQRDVIDLYYYKGFTEEEIGELKNRSQPLINKFKEKALRKMRSIINGDIALKRVFKDFLLEMDIDESPPKEILFYACPTCNECGFCDKFNSWTKEWTKSELRFSFQVIKDKRKTKKIKEFPRLEIKSNSKVEKVWEKKMPPERNTKRFLFEKLN